MSQKIKINTNYKNIVYARVSCNNNNNSYYNITPSHENQIKNCNKYMKKLGCKKVHYYYTEVGSAYKSTNMQSKLQTILDMQNINLFINSVCRFSRNIEQGAMYLEKAIKNNIHIYFVEEKLYSNNRKHVGLIKRKILSAEEESNSISSRMMMSIQYKKSKKWSFGVAPFGMKHVMVEGVRTLINNSEEQIIIEFVNFAISARFQFAKEYISFSGIDKTTTELTTKLRNLLNLLDNPHAKDHLLYFCDSPQEYCTSKLSIYKMLASTFNYYGILRRGCKWTCNSVKNITENKIVNNKSLSNTINKYKYDYFINSLTYSDTDNTSSASVNTSSVCDNNTNYNDGYLEIDPFNTNGTNDDTNGTNDDTDDIDNDIDDTGEYLELDPDDEAKANLEDIIDLFNDLNVFAKLKKIRKKNKKLRSSKC